MEALMRSIKGTIQVLADHDDNDKRTQSTQEDKLCGMGEQNNEG